MNTRPTRRTVVRGAAWSVPVISIAATAPAFATSLRKDPGISGWLNIAFGTENNFDARFRTDATGSTPDGAPFGHYLYDINRGPNPTADTVTGAAIILWFRGTVDSWSENSGHSSRWSNPTFVGQQVKPDTLTYYGYRLTYNGSVPGSGFVFGTDDRLYLEEFDITAESVNSSDATFWVERQVTVTGELKTFQRRNGERGALGNGFPGQRVQGKALGAEQGVWA